MKRLVVAGLILAGTAAAMPSDLPFETFYCREGKTIEIKFLSDGLSIDVRIGEEVTTVSPVDADRQAGFGPGPYRAASGDFTLTISEGWTAIVIAGKDVEGGPYEGCRPTPLD